MLGRRIAIASIIIGLVGIGGGRARAAPEGQRKAGRFMLNLKLGAAVGLYSNPGSFVSSRGNGSFALELDFGFAVTRDGNGYLVLSPQFAIRGDEFTGFGGLSRATDVTMLLGVPLGFQYDFPIRRVPGLYLYPRFVIGYGAHIQAVVGGAACPARGGNCVDHGVMFNASFGIKYVLRGRFNFGLEPLGLPVITNASNNRVVYRAVAFAGVNF